MSEELDYTPELYTLVDEDGKEQAFEMLDAMELDGQKYYALIPFQENPEEALEDDGELVVLKSQKVDGEEMLATIEDDIEFNKIGDIFLKRIESMFDEEDDDNDCKCGEDCECDGCNCKD